LARIVSRRSWRTTQLTVIVSGDVVGRVVGVTWARGVVGDLSKKKMCKSRTNELGVTQNIKLFKRGKATSRTPSCVGNKKLPKPPNSTGIMTKKTITIACNEAVVK